MTNSLTTKITNDADAQIATIVAAVAVSVAAVETETKRVITDLQRDAEVQLTKKKAHQELVATAKANQSAKIALAAAKRTAIDGLFEQVATTVLAESGAEYVARYTKRVQAVLPAGVEVFSVQSPADKADETKDILTALGIQAEVIPSPAVRAGLIVVARDGVYDASFDRTLSEVRPNLEMELIQTSS